MTLLTQPLWIGDLQGPGLQTARVPLGAARAVSENAALTGWAGPLSEVLRGPWQQPQKHMHLCLQFCLAAHVSACPPACHPHGGNAEEQGPSCLPLFAPFLKISWNLPLICPQFSPA